MNMPTWLTTWYEAKMFIERSASVSPDALHVLAGMLIAGAAAVLMRRPLSSWYPIIITLFATALNETGDLLVERWPSPGMQLGEGFRDLFLTMSVPTAIFIGLRFLPQLFAPGLARADEESGDRV